MEYHHADVGQEAVVPANKIFNTDSERSNASCLRIQCYQDVCGNTTRNIVPRCSLLSTERSAW
jgi:hypothetical protein